MREPKISALVIDDHPASRELLSEYLLEEGGFKVFDAGDARTGFDLFRNNEIDLVLLDVMLPDESGFDLCRRMKSVARGFVPVVMVTALNSTTDKVQGMEVGADDFISKPIIREELLARTRSHLRTKRMMDRIEQYRAELNAFNQRLQEQVEIRTRQLQGALAELKQAKAEVEETRHEIIERLGTAAEYRDQETGLHVKRMSDYVFQISLALGLPQATAESYRLAAPMHDIGKMGVRDHVLFKPAQLEEGEEDLIRQHTIIGAKIMANPRTELLEIAQQMARSHHERWDGTGYPDGLEGEEIPLPARVCAVADVFDALTSERVYRSVVETLADARARIAAQAGKMFDPEVVKAFESAYDKILKEREGDEQC